MHANFLNSFIESEVQTVLSNAADYTFRDATPRPAFVASSSSRVVQMALPINEGPGARHSNDFDDFRNIQIVPTEDEVLYAHSVYVPKNRPGAPHHLNVAAASQVDRLLDTHFRLIRNDMFASIMAGLRQLIQLFNSGTADDHAQFKKVVRSGRFRGFDNSAKFRSQLDEALDQQPASVDEFACDVDLRLFSGVDIRSVGFPDKGNRMPNFVASFLQPEQLRRDSVTDGQRYEYWKRSRALQFRSLVCLWLRSAGSIAPKLIFCYVAERDESEMKGKYKASISLQPCNLAHSEHLVRAINNKGASEQLIIEGPGLFEAVRPVLTALQTIRSGSLPFAEIFMPPVTPVGEIVTYPRPPQASPPRFAPPTKRFNLTSLVLPTAKAPLPRPDFSVKTILKFTPEQWTHYFGIDGTQADAVKAFFSQDVVVIQGPPGTGKTFIGIQLVKLLVNNVLAPPAAPAVPAGGGLLGMLQNLNIGPTHRRRILCVCYTNHALDQFLEGILNSGVTNNICRIGGRSTSERLEEYNLRDLTKDRGIKSKATGKAFSELKKVQEAVENVLSKVQSNKPGWRDLQTVIQDSNPDMARRFQLQRDALNREQAEGWQRVGDRSKHDPVLMWLDQHKHQHKPVEIEKLNKNKASPSKEKKNKGKGKAEDNNDPNVLHLNAGFVIDELAKDNLTPQQRQDHYQEWVTTLFDEKAETVGAYMKALQKCEDEFRICKDREDLDVLRGCDVIGVTTTGAAKLLSLLSELHCEIVICEEAAEVLEAHILASLSKSTEQLILIGDHQQLRPKVGFYPNEVASNRGFDLDKSLFERLAHEERIKVVMLDTQRRMRPEIANLIKTSIYSGLLNGPNVELYPPMRGFVHNVFFLDHNLLEDGSGRGAAAEARSRSNNQEAKLTIRLLRYVLQQGYQKEDVTILTPYLGQLLILRTLLAQELHLNVVMDERDEEALKDMVEEGVDQKQDQKQDQKEEEAAAVGSSSSSSSSPSKSNNKNDKIDNTKDKTDNTKDKPRVRIATIDNYQGEENTVLLISLVRSNDRGDIGFLRLKNRMNVLLSRAKHGMYLLGSASTLLRSKSRDSLWPKVLDTLKQKNQLGPALPIVCQRHPSTTSLVSSVADFDRVTPDGGCDLPCNTKMPCGHICRKRCHSDDPAHKYVYCRELCLKTGCTDAKHPCPLPCGDKCAPCKAVVTVTMPGCGHAQTMPCSKADDLSQVVCKQLIAIPLSCSHSVSTPCHVWTANPNPEQHRAKCAAKCVCKNLPCGHACGGKCGDCYKTHRDSLGAFGHVKCVVPCGRIDVCGHACPEACHSIAKTPCRPCKVLCPVSCAHHAKCPKTCSELCASCLEPCRWACPHGKGKCHSPCGAPCDRLPCNERCSRKLDCGHQCPSVCGETCPTKGFCHQCGEPDKLKQMADLISRDDYKDVDVNADPVIVLSCGHVFTISTLDGHVGIASVYDMSKDGAFVGLKNVSLADAVAPKTCPSCRQLITSPSRYGRAIKLHDLHHSEIKAKTCHGRKLAESALGLRDAWARLEQPPPIKDKAKDHVKDLLKASIKGMKDAQALAQDTAVPMTQQIYDKTRMAMQHQGSSTEQATTATSFSPAQADLSSHIEAKLLLGDWKLFNVQSLLSGGTVTEGSAKKIGMSIKDAFDVHESAYTVAKESKNLALMAQSRVKKVQTYCTWAMTLANPKLTDDILSVVIESAGKEGTADKAIELVQLVFRDHHQHLVEVVNKHPDANERASLLQELGRMVDKIKTIKRGLTAQEKLMIFKAVNLSSVEGSFGGHWYTCTNGHVYSIGECGGAMQQSTCPQCGATIGGADHRRVEGNDRAHEFLAEVRAAAAGSGSRLD